MHRATWRLSSHVRLRRRDLAARGLHLPLDARLKTDYSEWTVALNLECQFPLVIRQHFGVLLGFAFDQSFMDNRDPENGPDEDVSYRSIGVQVALFGWI